ncbi:hypothetical protein OPIT5_23375 [Opitutaceae bacterium TAV5]|nr:hypothetical protein OPIT5_23375 [Opitutaceae bacterium TAV5]
MKKISISTLILAATTLSHAAEWSVTFENKFTANTGQSPSNAWQAKLTESGRDGRAALLEGGGRLTYQNTHNTAKSDKAATPVPIISPVAGKIEFDFHPYQGSQHYNAAFDAGSILIFATQDRPLLRVTLKLTDAKDINLVAADHPLTFGSWNRIALEWDLTKAADQIVLSIDDKIVTRATTTATRLKDPDTHFTWGMFKWGGNPWNGIYDNLKIQ